MQPEVRETLVFYRLLLTALVAVLCVVLVALVAYRLGEESNLSDQILMANLRVPLAGLFCSTALLSGLLISVERARRESNDVSEKRSGALPLSSLGEDSDGLILLVQRANIEGRNSASTSVRWRQYEGPCDTQKYGRIMCVGRADPHLRMAALARRLVWTRRSVDLVEDLEAALGSILASPDTWSLIIVDVDHAEKSLSVEGVLSELVDFRSNCKTCTVVLLSHSFGSDDVNLIRPTIADYSFKATVTNDHLIATLPAVLTNDEKLTDRSRIQSDENNVVSFPRMEGSQ